MEDLVNPAVWAGRPVFVTGHTGFKGGWLVKWLARMGARVHGFALAPATEPSMFDVANIEDGLASDTRADVLELDPLRVSMAAAAPAVIFHLAAQPLVAESYRDPLGTFAVNVMGTANVLEAARGAACVRAIVVVTTDKVYANADTAEPFTESAPLGADADPYSASKAAAEIAVAAWRRSFFASRGIPVATARAGNVIGGGDWSPQRLLPDCLAAFQAGQAVRLRFPGAVRPWQHVIESLAGYITLAQALLAGRTDLERGWNYGPDTRSEATVGEVARMAAASWGEAATVNWPDGQEAHPREAGLLRLDSTAIRKATGWRPRWYLKECITRTVAWHRAWLQGADMSAHTLADIAAWENAI
ncbi:MAG: CDP-glucose 4,6-dehydratase [Gammaproteobacteria bacterium]|nr:CDP-glucose 4,6-dehydratase [Gammaproteobacteria bacterium]